MIVQGQQVAEWVRAVVGGIPMHGSLGYGWTEDGILVAGVSLEGFNGGQVIMHHRYEKSPPKSYWAIGADHIFNVMKAKRITGLINASNMKSKRLVKHLGAKHEATLKCAGDNGEDMEVWACFKEDCLPLKWSK